MKKQQLHESACDNQDRKMQEADTTVIPSLYTINSLAEKDAKLIGSFIFKYDFIVLFSKSIDSNANLANLIFFISICF